MELDILAAILVPQFFNQLGPGIGCGVMARSRRGQSGQSLLNGGGFTYLPWSNNDLN